MRVIILFIGMQLVVTSSFGQIDTVEYQPEVVSSNWRDLGVAMGINGGKYLYGEIGLYRSSVLEVGGFPLASNTLQIGTEFSYFDGLVLAPKVMIRAQYIIVNTCLSALFYTNLNNGYAIKLRPEFGFGLYNFEINYGYNLNIYKNNFERSNKHVVSVRYRLKFNRKYLAEYDREGNQVFR